MAEAIEKRGAGVIDQRHAGLLESEKIVEGNRGNHAAFFARERLDGWRFGGGGCGQAMRLGSAAVCRWWLGRTGTGSDDEHHHEAGEFDPWTVHVTYGVDASG
jgi:hypothetical protein